jgi:hypothetical protein
MGASKMVGGGGTGICPLNSCKKSKFKGRMYIKYTLQNPVYIPPRPLHTLMSLLASVLQKTYERALYATHLFYYWKRNHVVLVLKVTWTWRSTISSKRTWAKKKKKLFPRKFGSALISCKGPQHIRTVTCGTYIELPQFRAHYVIGTAVKNPGFHQSHIFTRTVVVHGSEYPLTRHTPHDCCLLWFQISYTGVPESHVQINSAYFCLATCATSPMLTCASHVFTDINLQFYMENLQRLSEYEG